MVHNIPSKPSIVLKFYVTIIGFILSYMDECIEMTVYYVCHHNFVHLNAFFFRN